MSRTLGQQIVIENKGGAGGSIATRQIARAAPDGYTLGLGGTGTLAINPTLYPNVGYDPRRDFAPVGLIASSALVVLVNSAVQARSDRISGMPQAWMRRRATGCMAAGSRSIAASRRIASKDAW